MSVTKKNENIEAEKFAFCCQVCGDMQTINQHLRAFLPLCDQCKSDLKEYVLQVRLNRTL